jgi:hypothetical protein
MECSRGQPGVGEPLTGPGNRCERRPPLSPLDKAGDAADAIPSSPSPCTIASTAISPSGWRTPCRTGLRVFRWRRYPGGLDRVTRGPDDLDGRAIDTQAGPALGHVFKGLENQPVQRLWARGRQLPAHTPIHFAHVRRSIDEKASPVFRLHLSFNVLRLCASTPCNRIKCNRGRGTSAARRCRLACPMMFYW